MSEVSYVVGHDAASVSSTTSSNAIDMYQGGRMAVARARAAIGEYSCWFAMRHGIVRELSTFGDIVSPTSTAALRLARYAPRHVTRMEDLILRRAARRSAKIVSRGRFISK